ncbi:cobalt-precorrin-6A reductase [Roseovarius sp. MMSF_3281]|uniref:cobalt-precorrin-6A reductase n=1 Tax=Roseovarius sp. MMSF_3281 TaxID=3046694 RepID=UPI00273FDDF0|nr:cobalt-precorrin-6A reductase [Roseovarius sp. MMSF_3281]
MTLLLLAGTGEAQAIAKALALQGADAVASLAGATRMPRAMALPTRHGGFGGAEGFRDYLEEAGISAVLDATHPFAHDISMRSAAICAERNIPYCQVLRPEWVPEAGDDWTFLTQEEDAARHIAPGATVFLATGRQTLHRFANLSACRLICRQIDPPDRVFPFPNGEFLLGRPPFPVEREEALFKRLGVDWLIVKNAGGEAPRSKLIAARQLGIKVAMINRPPQPEAPKVATVEQAMAWIGAL